MPASETVTISAISMNSSGAVQNLTAAEAISVGDVVFRNSSGKYEKLDITGSVIGTSVRIFIAITAASADGDQFIAAGNGSTVESTSAFTAGNFYYGGETDGQLVSLDGISTSGERVIQIGFAPTANTMTLNIYNTGYDV